MVSVIARCSMDPTSRLHVMLVADSLDAGGAERHVVDLAVALQSNNYRVTVVCSSLGIFQKTLVDAGIDVVTAAPRRIKRTISVPYARGLGELIAERKPDLIHSHMYASGAAAAMATRRGIPLVHTEHSEAAWRSPRAQLWSRWTYHRCARVIAVSRPIRERLIRSDGVEPSRVEVIGSAVPVAPAPRVAARGRIEREAPLVGVVARLHPEKGVGIFLEAAARVHRLHVPSRFVVVGSGPLRQCLERQAENLGLQGILHFTGSHPDARALLPLLDLLVVPSLSEGAPLVPLEAMHVAIPIVATTAGGMPEQIRHGKNGLLVAPGDAEALAGAMLSLLHEPGRRKEMGAAGRSWVLQHNRHEAMVHQTLEVYRAALTRTPDQITVATSG